MGEMVGRGYVLEDFGQAFKRYITGLELEALRADCGIWEGRQAEKGEESNEMKPEIRDSSPRQEEQPGMDTGERGAA